MVCGDARSVRFHTFPPHILRAVARLKLRCPGWLAALVTTGVGSGYLGERFAAWSAVVDGLPDGYADRRAPYLIDARLTSHELLDPNYRSGHISLLTNN